MSSDLLPPPGDLNFFLANRVGLLVKLPGDHHLVGRGERRRSALEP